MERVRVFPIAERDKDAEVWQLPEDRVETRSRGFRGWDGDDETAVGGAAVSGSGRESG